MDSTYSLPLLNFSPFLPRNACVVCWWVALRYWSQQSTELEYFLGESILRMLWHPASSAQDFQMPEMTGKGGANPTS